MSVNIAFQGYEVLKMNYERRQPSVKKSENINLEPMFTQTIHDNADNADLHLLDLGVKIDQPDFPIQMEVLLRGRFAIAGNHDDVMKMMQINATAILFPYLRSTLSMMTTLAAIPPITLPTVNMADAFLKAKEDRG